MCSDESSQALDNKPRHNAASLFSMQGRYNRAEYLSSIILAVFALVVAWVWLVVDLVKCIGMIPFTPYIIADMVVNAGIMVFIAFQVVKRLHDLDRPGVHYWLLLVPLYNIYLACLLLFKRGTSGPNRYGAQPPPFRLTKVLLATACFVFVMFLTAPRLSNTGEQVIINATRANVENISMAIDMYDVDNGYYPASLEALITKGSEVNWKGPYIKNSIIPKDHWGNSYIYRRTDHGYDIYSAGPDGLPDTDDDIWAQNVMVWPE